MNFVVYNDGQNNQGVSANTTCEFEIDITKSGYKPLYLYFWGVTGWLDISHSGTGMYRLGVFLPYLIRIDTANNKFVMHGRNTFNTTLFFETTIRVLYRKK